MTGKNEDLLADEHGEHLQIQWSSSEFSSVL